MESKFKLFVGRNAERLTGLSLLILFFLAANIRQFSLPSTIYRWTTTAVAPIILKISDNSILDNDLYTVSGVNSPKIISATFFKWISSIFSISWDQAVYLVQISFTLTIVVLLFFAFLSLIKRSEFSSRLNGPVLAAVALFFASGYITTGFSWSAGWWNTVAVSAINEHALSFYFGIVSWILYRYQKTKLFSLLFLSISTLFHPVVGLCTVVIDICFELPKILKSKGDLLWNLFRMFTVFLILLFLKVTFSGESIPTSDFIENYVHFRHPHHYLMSEVVNVKFFLQLLVFLALPFLLKLNKDTKITGVALAAAFGGAVALTYIGIEIFPIKIVAVVGPNRIASILPVALAFFFCYMIMEKASVRNPERKRAISFTNKKIFSAVGIILCVLSLLLHFSLYEKLSETDNSDIVSWLCANSSKNSVIALVESNTEGDDIRILAQRAVYSDDWFPFDEGKIPEWRERIEINKSLLSDINLARSLGIDYVISTVNSPELNIPRLTFGDEYLYIY